MTQFSIARGAQIAAPPDRVHALINDFRRWPAWSPWEDLDPSMTHTYTGAAAGVGAQHAWKGNSKAGQGSMEIVASAPERIDVALSFVKPFKATNRVRLDLTRVGGGTHVLWTMSGEQTWFGRLFFTLLKMEQALGNDFEKGLAKLKAVAEQG